MPAEKPEIDDLKGLRANLRSLGNRYAIEILQVLNPEAGDIIPEMGWEEIVEGLLSNMGYNIPKSRPDGERSDEMVNYDNARKKLTTGGTLYESMNKLVKAGYVQALGDKRKKQRRFMVTHEGRLALSAIEEMIGPISKDNELFKIAKVLLRHKNYTKLLPTQENFLREIGSLDENIIIQMPPGSGKTVLAMVAVLMNLQKNRKCLYISPYLSLNTQVINEYGELFKDLGYSVVRLDGTQKITVDDLVNADIVVGVYEAVLSDVLQAEEWVSKIRLTIVDELTELDSSIQEVTASNLGTDRSSRLDLLITLLKRRSRIITLSSRFGDTDSIAQWLDAKVFRPSVRLSPDEFIVTKEDDGVLIASSDGTQKTLLQKEYVLESIIEHLGDYERKSILVVVSSRYQAIFFAGVISRHWPRSIDQSLPEYVVGKDKTLPVAGQLYEFLKQGVAFHHSGLRSEVRRRLEEKVKIGKVRSVVSTTGITAGISFPFDCIVILFDRAMGFLSARSRYLQIAGRIGEYHLAKYGGSVYLVFEQPSKTFQTVEELEETLLHKPLKPIRPGGIHPSVMANLIVREAMYLKHFSWEILEDAVMGLVSETYRGVQHGDYLEYMKYMYKSLLGWMNKKGVFVSSVKGYRLSENTLAAARSGLGIIRYLEKQDEIDALDNDASDTQMIDLVLSFDEAQIVRPRTSYPTEIELEAAGLEKPDAWFDVLTLGRMRIKGAALERWINESDMPDVLAFANEEGRNMTINNENIGTVGIEEGDLDSLINICSEIAMKLSNYYQLIKRKRLSKRMELFSEQLRYGARSDIVSTDILELELFDKNGYQYTLPKQDARALYDKGYRSISDILKKYVDPEKKTLARDRFAENSGLDPIYAKEIYKAALAYVRARMSSDEED